MKFLKFSILSLLLFFVQNLDAQTPYEKYQQESIHLSNWHFVKNGQKYPLGFFGNRLGKALENSPNAYAEFKKFKKNRNISTILILGGLAAAYGAAYSIEDNEDPTNTQMGIAIGGLTACLVAIPFSVNAQKSFHKSIWKYNGDLLL